ncbi:MAG: selenide, water dikinase SelD [Spirochaetota bacterium]
MNENLTGELSCEAGGCSAKLAAQELDELLKTLPVLKPEELVVGIETHDDAAVWKVSDDVAIIQTTDFFPALCKNPYVFGQIAAANALSDVYAMGGRPLLALNIVMFPSKAEQMHLLVGILRGGADKVMEADAALAGGHTIDDPVPKYGLSVMGQVHPDRIIANKNGAPDQTLILTKPLGTGVIMAGEKIGECREDDYAAALASMMHLNKNAADVMQKHGIRCATDVTGFGLLGHALKMAHGSGIAMEIFSDQLPSFNGAYELLEAGCIPSAAFRNLSFAESGVSFSPSADYNLKMLALDAQTSGGILMCVPDSKVQDVLYDLHERGEKLSRVIGRTLSHKEGGAWISMS